MSATISGLPSRNDSKSSKKKKGGKSTANGKASGGAVSTSTGSRTTTPVLNGTGKVESEDGKDHDSPHIRELQKSVRNVTKKINSSAKADSVVAENPGKSLDELVADKKLNTDQKAQILKKPALQASLTQLEEQIAQYKKIDEEYQDRLTKELAAIKTKHQSELEQVRAQAKKDSSEHASGTTASSFKANTLLLSKFLRLAAARRQDRDPNANSLAPSDSALEGLLMLVYGGDEGAVIAIEKLINGSEEPILDTAQNPVNYTYAQVKQDAAAYKPLEFEAGLTGEEHTGTDATAGGSPTIASDPTVVNAGLTELDTSNASAANDHDKNDSTSYTIEQSTTDFGAANRAAEAHWEGKLSASAEGPDEWVEVPRDPAETESGTKATPAANTSTQSWADDNPTAPIAVEAATPATRAPSNDGFHEVHHSRGGRGRAFHGERRGSFRGRGGNRGEGGHRGRGGYRGDRGDRGGEGGYRGRGRGGYRGRGRDGDNTRRNEA